MAKPEQSPPPPAPETPKNAEEAAAQAGELVALRAEVKRLSAENDSLTQLNAELDAALSAAKAPGPPTGAFIYRALTTILISGRVEVKPGAALPAKEIAGLEEGVHYQKIAT